MVGDDKSFLLFGAGALGKVALNAAILGGEKCLGVFDDDPKVLGDTLLPGFSVSGNRQEMFASSDDRKLNRVFVAIGTPYVRRKLSQEFVCRGLRLHSIRHPQSVVSSYVSIGAGSAVMAGVNIDPCVRIGDGVVLNPVCRVAHDCVVGNYCQISDGAILTGGVKVGDEVFFGAGAIVRPDICICSGVTIGAGAVIVEDITTPGVYVGVPARRLKA